MRRFLRAGAVTAVAAWLVFTTVTPANAATRHRIGDSSASTFATASAGDRLVTMQAPTGRANQVWEFTLMSIGDRITSALTGGCLATPATWTGQNPPVVQRACQGTPYERWQRVQTSSTTVAFRNAGLQDRCITIDRTLTPAHLFAHPCDFGATNQRFRLMAP